jgi:hypothetical protein
MVFGTGVMGTMVPTQPSVSIHWMSNMAMHLSRKEKDYSWLRWMMQNNATTQLTLPWNIRLGQNLSFSLKDKMEEQKHLRLFTAKKPHEL